MWTRGSDNLRCCLKVISQTSNHIWNKEAEAMPDDVTKELIIIMLF